MDNLELMSLILQAFSEHLFVQKWQELSSKQSAFESECEQTEIGKTQTLYSDVPCVWGA